MSFAFTIAALIQLAVVLGIIGVFVRLTKRPTRHDVGPGEVEELREQVSLMRDFLRDAMDRIRRLEESQGVSRVDAGGSDAAELLGPGATADEGTRPPGDAARGPSSGSGSSGPA